MGCGSSFSVVHSVVKTKHHSNEKLPLIKYQERLENFEPFTLICLDKNFDDDNDKQLRSIIDYVRCFNDFQQCEQFILNNNQKKDCLFFIVSTQFATDIISHIHDLTQIILIYILQPDISDNTNDIIDEKWTKRYSKVKGIYLDRDSLLEELLSDVKIYANIGDILPITIYSRVDAIQRNPLSNDHLCFLFYQLFIDEYCLNSSLSTKTNLNEIIDNYYYLNDDELNEFNIKYNSSKNVLNWFLQNSFLRKLLTKSLLILNLKILFALRFFIRDIHKSMIDKKSRLPSEQIFYRSQMLSEETFQRIKANIGELLSINNFFLATHNRHDSLTFIRQNVSSTNLIYRILFEITIPSDYTFEKQRPFVDITRFSSSDKYSVLFSIGSIFRINTVVFDINNDCWIIQLTLYDKRINDDFSQVFTNLKENHSSITLANLLRQISPHSAEQFYKHILKENSESFSKLECYRGLGLCSYSLEDYEQALIYFEKALDMNPNDQLIKSSLHNSIGLVYAQQNEIDQAQIHFSQALKNSSLPLHIACAHHNLGLISSRQGLFDDEIDHYEEAIQIRTEQLPENHLQLASLYNNIGIAYADMKQYDKALSNLRKAQEIRLKLLPENHIDNAKSFANIGAVYAKTGEFQMALDYYKKAHILFEKQQPIPEQDIQQINHNIKIVNNKLRRKTC